MTFKTPDNKDSTTTTPTTSSDSTTTATNPAPHLQYKEPSWSLNSTKQPSKEYYFEIIKNGTILYKSEILTKSRIIIGEFCVCLVVCVS